jgi:subtilase family serine protease
VFEVENAGNAGASKSRVSYYLSDDSALDGTDVLLQSDRVSALGAGEISVGRLMARLPQGGSPFGRYVIAVVDAKGDVAETRELNNRVPSGPISAQSTSGPGVRRGGR